MPVFALGAYVISGAFLPAGAATALVTAEDLGGNVATVEVTLP